MTPTVTLPEAVFLRILELVRQLDWLRSKDKALLASVMECTSGEEIELFLSLVARFRLVKLEELKTFVSKSIVHCESVWHLDLTKCAFATVHEDRRPDSAQVLLSFLKPLLASRGIGEGLMFESLGAAREHIHASCNLVLLDDFVGSGDKLSLAVSRTRKIFALRGLPTIDFYGCFHTVQNTAVAVLSSSLRDFYRCEIHSKGISEYYTGVELANAIGTMTTIEDRLADVAMSRHLTDYRFGYARSEAIFAVDGFSPPDNLFPVFWWPSLKPSKPRKPMFER